MAENDELVSAACPQCGAEFQVPLSANGMTGECTACGAQFEIAFEMEQEPPAAESPFETAAPAEPAPVPAAEPAPVPAAAPAPASQPVPPPAPAPQPAAPKPVPSALKAPGGAKTWSKPVFTPENEMVSTNTIKLSRVKPPAGAAGLLPSVSDDKFKVGVIQPAAQMAKLGGTTQRKFSSGTIAPKKPAKKQWWEHLLFWR